MKFFLFPLLLLFSLNLSAQNILLFPETTSSTSGDMPANLCVMHSTRLINSLSAEDTAGVAQLRGIGRQLMRLGYHEYAREAFEKILDISSKAYPKTDMRYINAYIDLTRSYVFLIRYDEMLQMYAVAADLIIKVKGENSYEHALALVEAMEPHFYMRDYSGALRLGEKALRILEKIGKKSDVHYGIVLNNIAICKMYTLGPDVAVEVLTKAVPLLNNPKYSTHYQLAASANLAEAYARKGDKEAGKLLLEKNYPIAEKKLNEKITTYARVFLQYGNAFWQVGDFDKSEIAFKRAYTTNSLTYAVVNDIAADADKLFFKNQYLATCAQAGTTMYSVFMYQDKYKFTGDIKALKDALSLVRTMGKFKKAQQESYTSERNKLILFRLGATMILEAGIDIAYELYQKTGEKAYLEEAFAYSESGKSTILVNALRSKENKRFGNLPDDVWQKEKGLQAEMKDLQKRLAEAGDEQAKAAARDKLAASTRSFNSFKEMLAKQYPLYYKHYYDEPSASVKDIQKMLSAESALIEYNIAQGGNAYAFIITKNDFKMVKLDANQADIHLNGDNLRRTLSDYEFLKKQPDLAKAQFIASASFFYDKFLRKALSDNKNIKTLIIVPDKELGHLPFEVFLKNKPQQALGYAKFDYLLNDYAVTYSFSATQLIEKKAQDLKSKPQKRGVLAFAGDYREENKQIAAAENRSAGVRALRQNLQPLPGAEEEVAEMRKYMYGEFFNGKEAGEQIFKDKAKDYNIIHLAMHGLLDTKEPILSSLAFSEDGKADEDNFLYSYEITQLDLSARLVVLSACETGYGKFNQGEGVMSLAHSFMYAGASSVLVSLWQVNDRSTGEIMRYYYFNLAKGMTKGDALQKAKQEYLQKADDVLAQPAFWAAFVQLGDTVPLELVCKVGYTKTETMTLVAAIAGGLLLLGGAIWWLRRARK